MRGLAFLCALGVAASTGGLGGVAAATPAPKKLLDYHAYAAWRTIREVRLTREGAWLAYAAVPNQADGELVVRRLTGATEYREPRGRAPVFSADGRFAVYRIAAPLAEVKAAAKNPDLADEKKPKDGLGILDLRDGSATTVERVQSFALARDGTTLVYRREPIAAATPSASPSSRPASPLPSPETHPAPAPSSAPSPSPSASVAPTPKALAKDKDTSLAIRRLGEGEPSIVEHVTAYAVSANGARVAYVVQTRGDESLHVRELPGGSDIVVAHGTAHLVAPVLSRDGTRVAYLSDPQRSVDDAAKSDEPHPRPSYRLMVATAGEAPVVALGPSTAGAAPRTFASDAEPLEFSADGERIAFATTPVAEPRPPSAPPRVDLDFWYWRDGKLPTELRHDAGKPAFNTYRAVYDVAAQRFVQLGTPAVPRVELAPAAPFALGVSDVPYEKLHTWDGRYVDVYRIDMRSGHRTLLLRRLKGGNVRLAPDGRYAIGYAPVQRAWFTLRLADGRQAWISNPRRQRAAVEDDDHPDDPPAYGYAGFTPHDAAVLFYDRYDIWTASPDGDHTVMLTGGAGRKTLREYRVTKPIVDRAESAFVTDRPVFDRAPYVLNVIDDRTKSSGFATVTSLAPQSPQIRMLIAKHVAIPYRSNDGTRLVFSESRFDEFPDLWTSAALPTGAARVTNVNPQQAQYAWGHSRLIDYTNARGQKLRAILTTPDGFDPHRRYPMLVYVYEKMSDELHNYVLPASGTVVNLARYANRGYVVLQPDIRYRIGHTTASAVDCVTSAVKRIVAMGFVDPKRIGMAGHSYGGYEVNALVTHTTIFRAVESGASDSDLPSLYGGFWESGDVQQSYYETGQGRIGATPWARPDLYVENSPLFFVNRVTSPYLRIQDDQDGFVPYGQGVEFFTALRRAGKEAYMFTFIGENHGLAKPETKNYWTVHLDEFFDHFVLGTPRPEWMNHNGSFEHRGERDVEALFTPAA
jgi:dipeptidyl aminopeptidase/acylaminoacyl peptidase